MRPFLLPLVLVAVSCSSAMETVRPDPTEPPMPSESTQPVSRQVDVVDTLFGVEVPDPYRWLEDEKSPEVQAWMDAQDAYTRQRIGGFPGRDAVVERLGALAYVDSVKVPVKRGGRFFYRRTFADKEKAILYWKQGEAGEEKVLLDPNTWSKDGTVSLGEWVPSPDGKRVVFARKPNAADEAILHVIEVDTGVESQVDVIPGAKYAGPSWTPDGKAFVYEWLPTDPAIPVDERPGHTEIRLHTLGTDPKTDAVVHPALRDPTMFLNASLSTDGKYLFVTRMRGWGEMDLYWQRFGQEQGFRLLAKGIFPEAQADRRATFQAMAWKDRFYVVTNEGASNRQIYVVDPAKLGKAPENEAALARDRKAAWKVLVPERKDAKLEEFNIIGGHLALIYLQDASSRVEIATLAGKPVRSVPLPTIGTAESFQGQEDQPDGYFSYSSFTVPQQVYKVDFRTGQVSQWASVKLPIRPDDFEVKQVWFPSKDGTKVPMFLVHKKGLVLDGNNPTWLYGYGGFNVSLTPQFRSSIYPWLEAGGVYAYTNLRGGGEFGKAWHDAGRLDKKQNVFDDFASAAEWLVAQKYTQPKKIVIHGGSNGGLLVGTAMTQRPELYGAVLCAVPLLDMVRYHLFGSGRTWIPEYGTAEREADFKWIHAYSPYQHVKQGTEYPALLMLASDHDDRVDPMHARKFMAAIQNATGSDAPVLLRVERNAGHGGADMVKQWVQSTADQYAFVMERFGMQPAAAEDEPRAAAAQ